MTEYEASKVLDDYITLPEIFKFYGYEINRSGFCCCPFHLEDSPSCKVNDYVFHCFGCDARGNAISFMKGLFSLSFKDAVQKLNYDFNLGLLSQQLTPVQSDKIKKRQIEIYERKQKELDAEELDKRWMEAWKHLIVFEPEHKSYDINTPDYLVTEWENNVDPRYWEAINNISQIKWEAFCKGIDLYEIDEEWARALFTN